MKLFVYGLYSLSGVAFALVSHSLFRLLPTFSLAQVSISVEAAISLMSAGIGGVGAFYVAQMRSEAGDRELEKSISTIAASLEKELTNYKTQISDRIDRGQESVHQALREVERQSLGEISKLKTDLALLIQESQRADLEHNKILEKHGETLTVLKGLITECQISIRQEQQFNEIRRGGYGNGPSTGAQM